MHDCERLFGINRSVEIHKLLEAATGRKVSCGGEGQGPPCIAGESAAVLLDDQRKGAARLAAAVSEAYRR